ncbi:MAG: hypothetical protein U0L98_04625 [Clostridia bacterium]|nr:hypothetical protein [Clostridia bacterium]
MFGSTKTLISGAKRRSYRCRTRVDNGKKTINEQGEVFGCNSDIVYEDVLKECLKSILKEVIKDKEKIISDVEKIVETTINKRIKKEEKGNTLLNRKEDIKKERQRAIELCIKGLITEDELQMKKKEKEEELRIIDLELKEQEEEINAFKNKKQIIDKAKQTIEDIVETKIISDEVCKSIVDKVIVHSKADFDFYLKGNQGDYFKRKGVLLYNNHGII